MAVALPTDPAPATGRPKLRRFGGPLTPPLGGPVFSLQRLGNRFAVAVAYPAMTKPQADALLAALLSAETQNASVILDMLQGDAPAGLGSPLVAGGGQSGALLTADGFTAEAEIPAGALFSFTVAGVSYLHMVTEAVTASAGGEATLSIAPMLRASPADNAVLDFAAPKIEGLIEEEIEWSVDPAKFYDGVAFTIAERR